MIISHEHKFILLRTEKTGGSSLQYALLPFCGPADVISGVGEARGASSRPAWTSLLPFRTGGLRRTLPRYFGFHAHATAGQVRALIGRQAFDSYFKFAVERNPWDRQLSLYYQRRRGRDANFNRDMNSLVFRSTHYVKIRNWQVYTIDDEVVADQVIRYEQLDSELPGLLRRLGIADELNLQKRRSGFRPDARSYRELYSDATRQLVGAWYRREIEAFGYEF
jgi:hypothetical protein